MAPSECRLRSALEATVTQSRTRQSSNPEGPLLDAEIVVEGKSVAVNHSILSACSPFFHELFKLRNYSSVSEGKPKYLMTDLVPHAKVGYEAFNDTLHYLYIGWPKASPPEVSTCVDDACAHLVCPPAINYAIERMYASAAFQMTEVVSFYEDWLLAMLKHALVEDVIPILVTALHCQLNQLRSCCIQRIARSNLDNVCLEKELPDEVSCEIKSLRIKFNQESEANIAEVDPMHAKIVRGICKALHSGDVELLNLLLTGYKVTLDDAYALHYAAAYCSPNFLVEVLNMGSADLNLKDARGHTVLHVAARLACVRLFPSEAKVAMEMAGADTATGLSALGRKGLSGNLKEVDLNETPSKQAKRCQSRLVTLLKTGFSFHFIRSKLESLYSALLGVIRRIKRDKVCLYNQCPLKLSRSSQCLTLETLNLIGSTLYLWTEVETAHRYFPHYTEVAELMFHNFYNCSEVVDEFLDCDWSDASFLEKGTPVEQKFKRACFMKIKEGIQEAFCKDVAYQRRSGLPSSSSAFYRYMAESDRSGMPTSSASSN
ncbi:BTB/POZ domain and ankyrin repeat-containing protein NPR2 [Citrus sinensis]|nr:BTB/POZ domain and ankyrin repeat-containing protein NPR2 [Citrus sinensis]